MFTRQYLLEQTKKLWNGYKTGDETQVCGITSKMKLNHPKGSGQKAKTKKITPSSIKHELFSALSAAWFLSERRTVNLCAFYIKQFRQYEKTPEFVINTIHGIYTYTHITGCLYVLEFLAKNNTVIMLPPAYPPHLASCDIFSKLRAHIK